MKIEFESDADLIEKFGFHPRWLIAWIAQVSESPALMMLEVMSRGEGGLLH